MKNMNNDLFGDKYRIQSARAEWHDYNGGVYFVTICTKNHLHYFGEINDGEMNLSEIGRIATDNFQNVTTHYPYVEIPVFVIMPNHIHALLFVDGAQCSDLFSNQHLRWKNCIVNDRMRDISRKRGRVSIVIGGLKRAITKSANEKGINFAWQPRFFDRIIRNQRELNNIAAYIENNVLRWKSDEYATR